VYTDKQNLHVFKQDSAEVNPAELSKVCDAFFGDEDPTIAESKLVGFDYVQELEGAVLAFSSGSMYLYKLDTQEIEEVGQLPDGIFTALWSPNQEYFSVATKGGKLLLFTPEFDVLYEVDIDDDDLSFASAEEKAQGVRDVDISWRGDSSIFVVNYGVAGGRKCLTRDVQKSLLVTKGPARADDVSVFSVSEKPVASLELPINFMPSGSLVAGFQNRIKSDKQVNPEIIFWERNGLRHGQFSLPGAGAEPRTTVKSLRFNPESVLLAVHCLIDGNEQVLIYTRSNWEWYCKQVINTSKIASMSWTKKQQLCIAQ